MLTEGTSIWGMAPRKVDDFYYLPEAEAPLGAGVVGGGSGGGGKAGLKFRLGGGRFDPFNPTMGVQQSVYEAAMKDRYADTVIDHLGNKGYTGQGSQSRAGIRAPGYVNNTPIQVAPTYYPASSPFSSQRVSATETAKKLGGTAKNYFGSKRVTGGR